MSNPNPKRGFALLDKTEQRAVARRGGLSAQAQGKAHKFTPEEAREAGRKGGVVVSADVSYMARIGRLGGAAKHARRNGNAKQS